MNECMTGHCTLFALIESPDITNETRTLNPERKDFDAEVDQWCKTKQNFGVYHRTCIELKGGYDMIGMSSNKSETEQPIFLFLQNHKAKNRATCTLLIHLIISPSPLRNTKKRLVRLKKMKKMKKKK